MISCYLIEHNWRVVSTILAQNINIYGNSPMAYSKRNSFLQLICFVALVLGISASNANPEEILSKSGLPTPLYRSMGHTLKEIPSKSGLPTPLYRSMGHTLAEIPSKSGLPTPLYRSLGQPLTETETIELHQRRYIEAADNIAKLFSQLDQKVQEVTQAAKALSASPYDERILFQLLYKARRMENAQKSFHNKYSQLKAKMQYELRSFIDANNVFKTQQDKIKN